jgi:hypothetical protein
LEGWKQQITKLMEVTWHNKRIFEDYFFMTAIHIWVTINKSTNSKYIYFASLCDSSFVWRNKVLTVINVV